MIQENNCVDADTVFFLIAAILDRCMSWLCILGLTVVHAIYFKNVNLLVVYNHDLETHDERIRILSKMIGLFKGEEISVFRDLEDRKIIVEKFQMLHHVVEDIERYGQPISVDALPFAHSNLFQFIC